MSEVIFMATPGQSAVSIDKLDTGIRFVGNDIKTISVGAVRHGETIFLDEFDSLDTIEIEQPGARIHLAKFPDKTLKIKGSISSISLNDNQNHYVINKESTIKSETNLLKPIPFTGRWNVVITDNPEIEKQGLDALIVKPKNTNSVCIKDDWSHISIIGTDELSTVKVIGDSELFKFSISDAPKLKSVSIIKQVIDCTIKNCDSLTSLHGIGSKLRIKNNSNNFFNSLTISGFWLNVPKEYKNKVGRLDIDHFNTNYSPETLVNCEDLSSSRMDYFQNLDSFQLNSYFCNDFGIGLPIPKIIKLLIDDPPRIEQLKRWCHSDLSFFDQYLAMRILVSLLIQGFDQETVVRIRDVIYDTNNRTPISEQSISNLQQRSNRYRKIDLCGNHNPFWNLPQHSVADFSRLDLEMWLHCNDESLKISGLLGYPEYMLSSRQQNFERSYFESEFHRELLVTILSASVVKERIDFAQSKLEQLIELIFTSPLFPSCLGFAQFMVQHIPEFIESNSKILNYFIDEIIKSEDAPYMIASILAALVDKNNSTKARIELKRLAGDNDVSIDFAKVLNAISVLGRHAFDSNKAVRPKWPFIVNWRRKYGK